VHPQKIEFHVWKNVYAPQSTSVTIAGVKYYMAQSSGHIKPLPLPSVLFLKLFPYPIETVVQT
jgi:hypothetical protein